MFLNKKCQKLHFLLQRLNQLFKKCCFYFTTYKALFILFEIYIRTILILIQYMMSYHFKGLIA